MKFSSIAVIAVLFIGCSDGNNRSTIVQSTIVEIQVEIDAQNLNLIDNGRSTIEITIGAFQLRSITELGSSDTITVPITIDGSDISLVEIRKDDGNFEGISKEGRTSITISNSAPSKIIAFRVNPDKGIVDGSFTVNIGAPEPAGKLAVLSNYTIELVGASGTILPDNNELTIIVLDNENTEHDDTDGDGIADASDICSGTGFATEWTSTSVTDVDGDGCRDMDEDVIEDIDDDNDGLIEIYTLAQLNNIRYNLEGTSYKTSTGAPAVTTGAPERETTNCTGTDGGGYLCGYELMNDLDFDVDNDGSTWDVTTLALDTDDHNAEYFFAAATTTTGGWLPIGNEATSFNAIFEGNNHTITNLAIRRNHRRLGMFGVAGTDAHIRNIGLIDSLAHNTTIPLPIGEINYPRIGNLVGRNAGTITASYAKGTGRTQGTTNFNLIGGLVGENTGTITASYATSRVISNLLPRQENNNSGVDNVGGLVGNNSGTIIASYATGNVDADDHNQDNAGGLVGGQHEAGAAIIASYATGDINGGDGQVDLVGGLVGSLAGASIADSGTGRSVVIASYATGDVDGGDGQLDNAGGLIGSVGINSLVVASYATGNADGGDGPSDNVGGLVGLQTQTSLMTSSIIASYATGNANGGDGNLDDAGSLIGSQSGGLLLASYATGNADGGDGDIDHAGTLIGRYVLPVGGNLIPPVYTASYGFGTFTGVTRTDPTTQPVNGGISPALPTGVTTPTELTPETAGSCSTTTAALTQEECTAASGAWTTWNAQPGGINAWNFGNDTHTPVLRFADYDGGGGTDYCGTTIPSTFAGGTAITCGFNRSLLPGQSR